MAIDIPPQHLEDISIYENLTVGTSAYVKVLKREENRLDQCLDEAAKYFKIPSLVMMSVRNHEAGEIGSANPAAKGTLDYGPFQINTINLGEVESKYKITWKSVSYSACINAFVAGSLLKQRIEAAGNIWEGVGNYHYNLRIGPFTHYSYRLKVLKKYRLLVKEQMLKAQNNFNSKRPESNVGG